MFANRSASENLVATKKEECEKIEQAFFEKFNVYPVVLYTRDKTGDRFYSLELYSLQDWKRSYYKMGETVEGSLGYIKNLLKKIPVACIHFETQDESRQYKQDMRVKRNNLIDARKKEKLEQ